MDDKPALTLQELIRRRQAGGFVGRTEQVHRFTDNMGLAVEDPRRRFLFSVHGDAGVGKTFLVRQLARIARERGYLTAYVDEAAYDIPTAMEAIVADLRGQGARCKACGEQLDTYRRRRHELDADPGAPEGASSFLTRSAVRIGLRAAGDIPLVGAAVAEIDGDEVADQADRLRVFLSRKFRDREDVRLLLRPVQTLSPVFVHDVATAARRAPVALFFDTYERTGAFCDSWLLDLFAGRFGDLPANLVVTVSGQQPLDANRWGDYLGIRVDMGLDAFTDAEARQLLTERGVSDRRVANVIVGLSGRLPLLVAMLAEARPSTVEEVGDPSGDAVERFLKWETDERRRSAALHGALPRRLDVEVFAAATGSATPAEDFAWLRRLPFVVEHADGFRYHDVVRRAMLRVARRLAPADWRRRHLALADHYRAARHALGLPPAAGWQNDQWRHLTREEHYHRLCVGPTIALPRALEGLVDAFTLHPDSGRRWAQMITQAGDDADRPDLSERGSRLTALAVGSRDDQIRLLTELTAVSAIGDGHRAVALADRAQIHRLDGRYDDALADFTRALELNPAYTWAFGGRGQTYHQMRRYDDAVADLTRAVELRPTYAWAIASRGQTYRHMGRYDDAVADLTRAVELRPTYAWAVAERAETYRHMGRYDDAVADLTHALVLNPGYAWAAARRGLTYRRMGRYDDAVADLDRALELNPGLTWALTERAAVHRAAHRYDDALADLALAVELDPQDESPYYQTALVMFALDRPDDAHPLLERAVGLARTAVRSSPRAEWRVFDLVRCLAATGRRDEARALLRDTLADDVPPHRPVRCVEELEELRAATGPYVDVGGVLALLRSHLGGVAPEPA